VHVGVIARDHARVHRRGGQRRQHAGAGRRGVDPAEERRVTVAHRVRNDVAQCRRDEVVERLRVLRQRQAEQPVPQRVGERLPDGSGRQCGEVLGHAVHERMTSGAEGLEADSALVAGVRSIHRRKHRRASG
jgi:hypothetical protein